ncbi:hypothetical protein JB92DRAFT_2838690 [Gautieria morchelliformis]|nr:hypothetical protein JB92DRAFT_2838690 [Gautieria morchelliformis]
MSTRNEVMLEGSRKSILDKNAVVQRVPPGKTAPALAVVICPLGSPHSQPSRTRTHVEVVRGERGRPETGRRPACPPSTCFHPSVAADPNNSKPAVGPQRQVTLNIQLEKILLQPLLRLRSCLQLAHPDVSHVLILHTQHYTLNVSVGLAKGCEFVFEAEGDESPDWEAGNIIIRVLDGKKKGD